MYMIDDNCQKFIRMLIVSSFTTQDWNAGLSGHITVDLKEVSLRFSSSGLFDGIFKRKVYARMHDTS